MIYLLFTPQLSSDATWLFAWRSSRCSWRVWIEVYNSTDSHCLVKMALVCPQNSCLPVLVLLYFHWLLRMMQHKPKTKQNNLKKAHNAYVVFYILYYFNISIQPIGYIYKQCIIYSWPGLSLSGSSQIIETTLLLFFSTSNTYNDKNNSGLLLPSDERSTLNNSGL